MRVGASGGLLVLRVALASLFPQDSCWQLVVVQLGEGRTRVGAEPPMGVHLMVATNADVKESE